MWPIEGSARAALSAATSLTVVGGDGGGDGGDGGGGGGDGGDGVGGCRAAVLLLWCCCGAAVVLLWGCCGATDQQTRRPTDHLRGEECTRRGRWKIAIAEAFYFDRLVLIVIGGSIKIL